MLSKALGIARTNKPKKYKVILTEVKEQPKKLWLRHRQASNTVSFYNNNIPLGKRCYLQFKRLFKLKIGAMYSISISKGN